MKKTPSLAQLIERIQTFSLGNGGVFTFADLWNLIGLASSDRTAKVLRRFVAEKVLLKIRRGIYTTKRPDLWLLGFLLKENACISLDSVLAKEGLTGTSSPFSVSLVYPGPAHIVETPCGRLRYFQIKKELLFGAQATSQGMRVADKEKAFLDLLYYHLRGARFAIDPTKDVDLWKLDVKKITAYLARYQNPKFRQFVKGILHEYL